MSQIELIFIRHGEASDAWNNHPDPGLSKTGISQSNDLLNNKDLEALGSYSFISSPKLRAIETAKPLVKKFNKELKIDNDFIEIPSENIDLNDRQDWIQKIIKTNKKDLPDYVKLWSENIYKKTISFKKNSIIFTHFMVINALISDITSSDTLLYFHPGYTSIVKIKIAENKIQSFLIQESEKTHINI
tara:strand:- start:33 stop:596 length:564 start_codon:yes stop_codon:yes gene_type:complete